ncbi:hypothetical protein Pst134EB_017101 [Puccinia striiformis f. sp. tritici]|nr:hypothetical protein Pst134EB_017101 [Puccinia striiformis f. sp. tritici]
MDEFKAAQLAITQAQDSKIGEMQSDMREMKEMFKMFLNQAKAPENIPIPATPEPRPSARFATSTPFTSRTPGLDTTIRGNYTSRIEDSLLDSAVPSPEDSQFKSQSEIFLPVEKTKVMLDVKKLNFHFKGTEVETFIRRVEKLANLQGAAGPDVASQLPFLVSDQKISQHIEDMEGHETGNWDLLKKQLIRKWGRATPLQRFNKDSIPTLISKHTDKGGIQNREEYRSFVNDLEEILAYLTKMGYNDVNAGSGEPLWKAISAEMRKDVAKELAHDKKFKKTKDGIALIPNLEPLKEYVEAALLVLDLEEGLSKTPSVSKKPETKKEVKTQPKEEEATGKVSELEEEIKKLRTVLNTNQNARQLPPHMQPNFRPQNYGPPGMGPPPFPRPQFKCYYCDSTEHSSMFCPKLPEDIANKLVIRSGPNYYYPNREPIPRDTGTSVMELVHKFHEAAAQDKKTNVAYMEPAERQEPTASMISTNRWEMWSPPEMHYGKEDEENLIGFGLRRSARTNDKDKGKAPAQPTQSQPESTGKSSQNAPKAPPGNQEANKNPPEPRKRRPSYPGAWVEGTSDDGSTEDGDLEIVEESLKKPEKIVPKDLGKNKRKEPEKEAEDELVLVRPVEKSKVGGGLKKKIFKQSFTLTLEELLLIAPNFLQELQDLAEDDAKPLSRSQNSGRCDHRDFDGELHNNHGSGALGSIKRSLTYACPLGFVYITMGSTKVKALVDTGAEMNIMPESLAIQLQLPLREISMNIMGIGGHSTPIVGLAEGINFSINTEDEKAANFFIARGKVYTVLGRPFLADHKVRLELSKSQGEILSYELWDGERLCIPICSPKVPGWEMGPPRRIEERCFSIQAENYELASRNVASFSRSSTSIINNIKASADSNLKTLDDDLDTMDNDSRTVDSDSRTTDNDSRTMDSDLGTVDNNSGVADSNLGTMDNDLNTLDDDSGVAESDLGTTDNDLNTSDDDSGVADSELGTTDNDLRTTVSELGTSDDTSSTVNNDSWNFDNSRNLTEGSKDLAHCGPGKEERNFLSLSVEDQDDYLFQNIWENWEIEQEELNSMRTHWTYSDNFDKNQLDPWASCNQPLISENSQVNWNQPDYYKQTQVEKTEQMGKTNTAGDVGKEISSSCLKNCLPSQELCKEFPGFLTGRDDFMVFLDWSGTKSYLGNLSIWPDEDCLSDQVKVALYEWGSDGRYYMNKDTYHIAIVTGEYGKEDGFLDKVVRMKLLCGKFDWELFKYVLEEDQEKWETQHQNILSGASVSVLL